jgi:RNA polymerase-binding transcription factor DksA
MVDPDTKTALTDAQLAQLRKLLDAKRRELVESSRRERSALENPRALPDPMELAERMTEESELVAIDAHDSALLVEVEHALAKLDAGTYGTSEEAMSPSRSLVSKSCLGALPGEGRRAPRASALTASSGRRRASRSRLPTPAHGERTISRWSLLPPRMPRA